MQPHILAQSAIVGIEVLIVPLKCTTRRFLAIAPTIIHLHGDDIISFLFYIRCQVKTEGGYSVLIES